MSSKAQRWYDAQQAVQRSFKVAEGVTANIVLIPNSGPCLEIVQDSASSMPNAAQALAFARWIWDQLGKSESSQ